jgi:hypothetical protein
MTSYTLSPVWGAGAQLFDNSGNVLTGGKIETYEAGTTTNAVTYTDPIGNTFNSNPIIADASGRLSNEIWLPVGTSYKFVLKDANNVLIATYDNIPSTPQPPITNDASSISYEQGYTVTAGAFTVGATYRIASVGTTNFVAIGAAANVVGILFTATGAGSGTGTAEYSRTVQVKLRETISVQDFGAVGDGVTDDTAAIKAAGLSAVANNVPLFIPKTNSFYSLSNGAIDVTLNDGQSLTVLSNGAELRQVSDVSVAIIGVSTTSSYSAPVGTNTRLMIDGLIFNGIGIPQQWSQTNFALLTRATGIYTDAETVSVTNCKFENLYGTGMYSLGPYMLTVDNCQFNNVGGHWYLSNAFDAFGDSIYIGYVKAQANIYINQCNILGYVGRFSRAGVVFEYSTTSYIAVIQNCTNSLYERAVHVEENSQIQLSIVNCKFNNFRVGVFGLGALTNAILQIINSSLVYASGDYNGSAGWTANSCPIQTSFKGCYLTVATPGIGFASNANIEVNYFDTIIDYNSTNCILSNSVSNFYNCVFKNIVAASYYFFSGTQKFVGCKFYGTANVAFTSTSGLFAELIGCVSYGPLLAATIAESNSYSGFAVNSQLATGFYAVNGTTRYAGSKYSIFPDTAGLCGEGSGLVAPGGAVFVATPATVPTPLWANASKATLIAKFSDGASAFVLSRAVFYNPSGFGLGYYSCDIELNSSGVWVIDGTVTTHGSPGTAGFDGSTVNGFTWTAIGAFATVCQVLIVPREESVYII